MQEAHFRELSRSIGVTLGGTKAGSFDDDIPSMVASNDPILGLINLARLRKVPLREQYNQSNLEPDWNTVNYVDKCLREYKESMGLYDFTDMLAEFVKGADTFCPDFDLCFLDEAQDLSPLQWELAHAIDGQAQMWITLLIFRAALKHCHSLTGYPSRSITLLRMLYGA